jgi:membrane protease YdiL (CAAX protease family)
LSSQLFLLRGQDRGNDRDEIFLTYLMPANTTQCAGRACVRLFAGKRLQISGLFGDSINMTILKKYFSLTYAVSWTCFISAAVISERTPPLSPSLQFLQQSLLFLGAITPSLVALFLTARTGKIGETKKLLSKIGKWQVGFGWYLFAIFFLPVIKLIVALIHHVITGTWPRFGQEAWYIIVAAIVFSTCVQAGEEIGWRGFALPKMTAKFGLSFSTLLLGVSWACWHLPLFFVQGADKFGQSFFLYMLQVVALSVVVGYLYWRTKGSLLLVMLMHAAANNTKDIVPSVLPGASNPFGLSTSLVGQLTVAFLWISAIYFLMRMRNVKLLE